MRCHPPTMLGMAGIPSGGGGTSADLTAPAAPAAVSLASSATSLGSTLLGSWSASVTVTATCEGSDGSTPTVTVSGSGAGPYSVSIASGLAAGVSYVIRAVGTGGDGQVAGVSLLVRVGPAMGWTTLANYDLTAVDTASAVTATGGDLALTVGGVTLLTLRAIAGSGTGSLTPTNGSGVIFSASGGGVRTSHVDVVWSTFGVDLDLDTVAVQMEFGYTSIVSGGVILPMIHSSGSGFSANSNFGVRWALNALTYAIAPRFYHGGAATLDTALSSGTTAFSGNYSASMTVGPGGQTVRAHVGSMVLPPSMSLGPRRFVSSSAWAGTSLLYPAGPPRPAFGVQDASATLRRIRLLRWGV